MLTIRCRLFFGALAALSLPAQPVRQEPTVITVTGRPTPVSQEAASVTVLDRQSIERSHARTAADLLRQVPFLSLTQAGPRGSLTTVTLRGAKPNFTLVLVDGVAVNDISNTLGGSYDFSSLSTDSIEQIEIVRGPMSSMYGSSAIGGVINILTRKGEGKPRVEVTAGGGSFGTGEGQVSVSGSQGRFSYTANGGYLRVGEQVLNDAYSLGTAGTHLDVALGNKAILSFVLRYQNRIYRGFPANGGGPEFSLLRGAADSHSAELISGVSLRQELSRRWSWAAEFGSFNRNERSYSPAILDRIPPGYQTVPESAGTTEFDRYQVRLSANVKLGGGFSGRLFVGDTEERGNSNGYMMMGARVPTSFQLSRNTLRGGGELAWEHRGASLTAGVSFDRVGAYDVVATPRFGASVPLNRSGTRAKATWAEGFNMPSFYSLGNPLVGNPNLRPEHSRSYDTGLEQELSGGRVLVGATYFHNRFTDLIDFSPQLFRLVNRRNAYTQGGEFSIDAQVRPSLRLGASAAYTTWQLENTTEPLRDQPHWRMGIHGETNPTRRLTLTASTVWVTRRYDYQVPVPQRTTVGGYSTSSLAGEYRLGEPVSAFARVDNLLASHHHEFVGFPATGQFVRFGLIFRLNISK